MSIKAADSPASAHPKMALLKTAGGETIELLDRPRAPEKLAEAKDLDESGGLIYTDELPKIEELLQRYEIQFAILDKVSESVPELRPPETKSDTDNRIGYLSMLVVGGLPAATFAAGLVMLVGVFFGGDVVSNAYIAVLLFLGGIGLGLTAHVALNEAPHD